VSTARDWSRWLAAVTGVVMSLSRMASVDYLVGHVAAGDGRESSAGSALTRYYTAEGYPPGTWLGTGLKHDLAGRETRLEAARRRVAETASGNASDANDSDSTAARREWLTAIEKLLPATLAVERAAASMNPRRTNDTERRMAANRRHPHVGDLLNAEDDPMPSGN